MLHANVRVPPPTFHEASSEVDESGLILVVVTLVHVCAAHVGNVLHDVAVHVGLVPDFV